MSKDTTAFLRHWHFACLAFLCAVLCTAHLGQADVLTDNTSKFAPPTAITPFGWAVDIAGDVALVGAPYGGSYGKAFIHERGAGGTDNWGNVTTLSDTATYQGWIGDAVALSSDGDTAFVGQPNYLSDGDRPGRISILERDYPTTDAWGLKTSFDGSDTDDFDNLGDTIDVDGTKLVVGAPNAVGQSDGAGQAYAFYLQSGSWTETKILTTGEAALNSFAWDVAISGDTIAVGAMHDDDEATDAGAVYIFEKDIGGTDNWGLRTKITLGGMTAGSRITLASGFSVDARADFSADIDANACSN